MRINNHVTLIGNSPRSKRSKERKTYGTFLINHQRTQIRLKPQP